MPGGMPGGPGAKPPGIPGVGMPGAKPGDPPAGGQVSLQPRLEFVVFFIWQEPLSQEEAGPAEGG